MTTNEILERFNRTDNIIFWGVMAILAFQAICCLVLIWNKKDKK